MKTTLIIDDSVFKLAKQQAVARDTTLGELVTQSLSHYLHSREIFPSQALPFSMPVFGQRDKIGEGRTPAQLAALRDDGR